MILFSCTETTRQSVVFYSWCLWCQTCLDNTETSFFVFENRPNTRTLLLHRNSIGITVQNWDKGTNFGVLGATRRLAGVSSPRTTKVALVYCLLWWCLDLHNGEICWRNHVVEAISNYLFQIWGVEPPLKSLSSESSDHPRLFGLHDVHLQYLYFQGKPNQNCYLMFLGVIMSILFFSGRECAKWYAGLRKLRFRALELTNHGAVKPKLDPLARA